METLKSYGISPHGMVGHSVGELACAFADNTLTAEQTIMAAYWRGKCVKEANLPQGGMAAVGKRITRFSSRILLLHFFV